RTLKYQEDFLWFLEYLAGVTPEFLQDLATSDTLTPSKSFSGGLKDKPKSSRPSPPAPQRTPRFTELVHGHCYRKIMSNIKYELRYHAIHDEWYLYAIDNTSVGISSSTKLISEKEMLEWLNKEFTREEDNLIAD
ncbi:hypothetical protein CEW46_31435, partial [Bacillus cereus]